MKRSIFFQRPETRIKRITRIPSNCSSKIGILASPKDENTSDLQSARNISKWQLFKLYPKDPWSIYKRLLSLDEGDLGASLIKSEHPEICLITELPEIVEEPQLHQLDSYHQNLVQILEVFTDRTTYVVYEHMPLSVREIILTDCCYNEPQIATMCKQVRYASGLKLKNLDNCVRF